VAWRTHDDKATVHEESKSVVPPGRLTDDLGFRKAAPTAPRVGASEPSCRPAGIHSCWTGRRELSQGSRRAGTGEWTTGGAPGGAKAHATERRAERRRGPAGA
jgi:hypothetical protein